jgi:hypothetical protein
MTLRSWVVISAKPIRITTAAPRPSTITGGAARAQAGGGQAHRDGVVAGQHQVDQQDLDQGGQAPLESSRASRSDGGGGGRGNADVTSRAGARRSPPA